MPGLEDLDFRHLTALCAVARERSFGRAAQVLGYTQSAVSQQIASLERHVGGSVFDRPGGPRQVELTPLGRLLLEHAEALLSRLAAADADLRAFQSGHHGALSVGTFQSVSVRVLPAVVHAFRAERADVELRLHESDDLDSLVDLLRDGELEVSFIVDQEGTPGRDELTVLRLFDDPFVLISPAEGEGDRGTSFDMHLLPGLPMVGEFDSACHRQLEQGLRNAGVDLSLVFRSNDNGAIQAMVRAGVGHAVMPALAVHTEDPEVLIRRLDPGIPPRTVALAWRANRTLSPAAEAFVEIARRIGHEMAERQVLLDEVV